MKPCCKVNFKNPAGGGFRRGNRGTPGLCTWICTDAQTKTCGPPAHAHTDTQQAHARTCVVQLVELSPLQRVEIEYTHTHTLPRKNTHTHAQGSLCLAPSVATNWPASGGTRTHVHTRTPRTHAHAHTHTWFGVSSSLFSDELACFGRNSNTRTLTRIHCAHTHTHTHTHIHTRIPGSAYPAPSSQMRWPASGGTRVWDTMPRSARPAPAEERTRRSGQ